MVPHRSHKKRPPQVINLKPMSYGKPARRPPTQFSVADVDRADNKDLELTSSAGARTKLLDSGDVTVNQGNMHHTQVRFEYMDSYHGGFG